jgi:hypothetical protein
MKNGNNNVRTGVAGTTAGKFGVKEFIIFRKCLDWRHWSFMSLFQRK